MSISLFIWSIISPYLYIAYYARIHHDFNQEPIFLMGYSMAIPFKAQLQETKRLFFFNNVRNDKSLSFTSLKPH